MCVRSSIAFYGNFNLDMDRSPGFGSTLADSGPIKTWFPFGSTPEVLNLASLRNSPDRSTKSTRLWPSPLPQLVNTGFQVLFHSPPGVLFTFPSQYSALSVTKEYLPFAYGAFTLSGRSSQDRSARLVCGFCSPNPRVLAPWFGLFRVRSPLLTESIYFLSLPPAT